MVKLSDITLNDFILYQDEVKEIDEEYELVFKSENISQIKKEILLTKIFIKRAKITFKCFGKSTNDTDGIFVDFLVSWYNSFNELFSKFETFDIGLEEPELTHNSNITFGQFIDAKMIVSGGSKSVNNKWQVLQYIMSIFLTNGSCYKDEFTYEKNENFIRCGNLRLDVSLVVSKWWEQLNIYINEHYTVFQETGDIRENCENVDSHMERWGWVNFLKSIAKTKAFDISGSGMNSIDCVRKTKASEILIWASEEKEYNVAANRDMKEMYKNH